MRTAIIIVLLVLATATAVGVSRALDTATSSMLATAAVQLLPSSDAVSPLPEVAGLVEPVNGFLDRITKKTFGMYITPDTSPVENDRFTGFHTGVDAEFTDTTVDVPVFAIADGTIVLTRWVNGYGGVIVLRHVIEGQPVYALYGHLDAASFPAPGTTTVTRGERIGILGEDHSEETDGVRKHLHFAIYTGETIDYRGYVPESEDLANWLDPLVLWQ